MWTLAATNRVGANQLLGDYIGVFFVSFVVCFACAPLMRWLATRHDIMDKPDTRKGHLRPVAYLGGVALFLGWLAGVVLSFWIDPTLPSTAADAVIPGVQFPIIFGATVIMVTGLIDDAYGISPRVKVGGQFMAAAALAWSSQNLGMLLVSNAMGAVGIDPPFLVSYVLGAVLIAAFVLGGCNAMNLLDGLDGLATGVTAIISLGLLFIAVYIATHASQPGVCYPAVVMCLALLGATVGFLPYNFNPANIFMGDTGSLLLGYLCVTTILLFAEAPSSGPMYVTAALIVYALPLMDMFITISRRALQGKPLAIADKKHLHHKVLTVVQQLITHPNLSVKLAVLVMYVLASVFAVVGCSLVFLRWRYVSAVFLTVFGFILVGAYKTGQRQDALEQQINLTAVPPHDHAS